MVRRRISLVLCFAMLVMLLPVGLFSIDVSAIERPTEQYVSAGTNWTTTTDYTSAANEGNDDTLYYKDGEDYYPVSWETGKELYTEANNHSWKPNDVNSSYYYNINEDELTFSQVSTKNGTGYKATNQQFDNDLFSTDIDDYHTRYYVFTTNFFVKYGDEYRRLLARNKGILASWGDSFSFEITLFHLKNETNYASYMSNGSTIISVEDNALIGRSVTNKNFYSDNNNNRVSVSINGSTDAYHYRRHGVGYKTDMYDTYYTTIDATLYEKATIKNSIWYNGGNSQLGNTVLDETTAAYNGSLYTKNGTGTTTLTYRKGSEDIPIGTATAINGKTIYSDDLYVLKTEPMPTPEPTTVIHTEETGDDGVYTHKDLDQNGDSYDITLTAYTTGNEVTTSSETTTPTVDPMDIALVIDQSGSMATRDMGNTYAPATTPDGGWTVGAATGGKQYYYSPDNGLNYYPVYASSGYVYEKVDGSPRASDMLGSGDDAISLGVNGAPTYYNIKTDYYVMYEGEPHRLYLITAGLFLQYGLYAYIYTDENDPYASKAKWEGNNYWVAVFDPWDGSDLRDEKVWNSLTNKGADSSRVSFINQDGQAVGSSDSDADDTRLSYSWFTSSGRISNLYQLSSTKVANQLYYIDSAGNKQLIGDEAKFADDVVYSGTLYEGTSESRVEALKKAVSDFAETVQANAEKYEVDHRMAIMGFAGNKIPGYSTGDSANTVGSNGLKDYTNTGLFESSGFENYEKITGYKSTTDRYINRHYYQLVNGNYIPVKYVNGQWNRIDLATGKLTATNYSSSNWYEATYEGNGTSLSSSDYNSALFSVNAPNDSKSYDDNTKALINTGNKVNDSIDTAISQFSANGGTYTSYGMTMAEQMFNSVTDTQAKNSEDQMVDRKRVIVVFTDGEPGANGYNSSIAGEALASGNKAQLGADGRANTDDDVIIYTVGLFKTTPSSEVKDFMQKLSSEYSVELKPVYGGEDNSNYSLGALNPNKTYYYLNETTGKYYAVTTEYGSGNSLGWWVYNDSHTGETTSYSLTTPKRSTGAGTTVFYDSSNKSVNGEDVKIGTTYYTEEHDKIVYEYRWFDSDRSIKNPYTSSSGSSTSAGEARVQFYELGNATSNPDELSYYMTAKNAEDLNNVFAQIAGSIITTETTISNESQYTEDTLYVMDEISADFDLPEITAENNHVKVYADTVSEWNADGSPKTYNESTKPLRQGNLAAIEAGSADVEVVWEGKKLQINYFDFGRMYMQESNPNAARIRVVIDGITPNTAGEKLYSNTSQSGLYYKDPDTSAVTMVEAFNRPYISNPGYTVKWVDDEGTNMEEPYDQDVDLLKGDVPVYDGEEPTKDSEETATSYTTYKFDGWSTSKGGPKKVDIERDPESGVVTNFGSFDSIVNEDVTYYAYFAATTVHYVTATWYNGTEELYQQKKVPEGESPEYAGSMPTKASDSDYTYFLAGWKVGERYNSTDSLSYDAIKNLSGDALTQYLNDQGIVSQFMPIDSDTKYYAVFAPLKIKTHNFFLDFNTKTKLKENTVTDYDVIYSPGGDFSLEKAEGVEAGSFFFTPGMNRNRQYGPTKDYYNFSGFSEVNSSIYYEGDSISKANVIPASSVYFDDDLLNVEATPEDGSGKNSAIPANTSVNSIDTTDTVIMNYTFIGTGIDVYCTTDSQSGYIMATLYKLNKDGTRGERVDKAKLMNNKSTTERLNVPTISFTGYESGTYQLELQALKNSKYKLDGIRIYNPVKDQSVYVKDNGEDSTEKNATYLNLRKALITGTSGQVTVDNNTEAIISNEKVLFVDDVSKLDTGATRVVVDEEGKTVYNEDGTPKTVPVYESQFAAYKANSPKNEIYLEKGQAITFQLTAAARTGNLWIGLSAPDKGKNSGTVTINGSPVDVTSALDMYYPVTVGDSGSVTVTNTGDNMISITNLKITGVVFEDIAVENAESIEPETLKMVRAFAPLSMRTVMLAANDGVDIEAEEPEPTIEPDPTETAEPTIEPDPTETTEPTIEPEDPTPTPTPTVEPTPQPSQSQTPGIVKIISNVINSIVKSIRRLFGR